MSVFWSTVTCLNVFLFILSFICFGFINREVSIPSLCGPAPCLWTNHLSLSPYLLPRLSLPLSNQRAGCIRQGVGPSDRTLRRFPGGTPEGDLQPALLPKRVSQSEESMLKKTANQRQVLSNSQSKTSQVKE